MALIKCKECGQQISSGARACPHCGKRRTHPFTMLVAILIFTPVFIGLVKTLYSPTKTTKQTTKVEKNKSPPPLPGKSQEVKVEQKKTKPPPAKTIPKPIAKEITKPSSNTTVKSIPEHIRKQINESALPASSFSPVARTYCQQVNLDGYVVNVSQITNAMNRWMVIKGINYQTTEKEIGNTVMSYCRQNPLASPDDATQHLENILDSLASFGL